MAAPRLRRLGIAAAVVLGIGGAAAVYVWRTSGHSTPVSRNAAVERYRATTQAAGSGRRPETGVYSYALDGWECAGVGPLCLHRTLPSQAELIVTRGRAGLTLELDVSAEHVEAQRFAERPGGRYLTWKRTRIAFAGVTRDDAHATTPVTLALPARLHVGQRWTARFHDAGLPVVSVSKVLRRAIVNVAGTPFETYVIRSVSTTGGAHPGTDRELTWHSEQLGLDLRLQISREIHGVFPYRMQATGRLLDLTPAR
jgi:hypothetical protein